MWSNWCFLVVSLCMLFPVSLIASSKHHDVITWKCFPCYWSYVGGIHRLHADSPHKGPIALTLTVFLCLHEQMVEKQCDSWYFLDIMTFFRYHCRAMHYSDVIMRLKSPAFRLFTQPFVQAQIKENIKTLLAFVRGIHRWPVDSPHTKCK